MSKPKVIVEPKTQAQAGVAELGDSDVRAWAREKVATAPPIGSASALILVTAFSEALASEAVAA